MKNIDNIIIQCTNIIFISDVHLGVRSSSEEWQENIKTYFYNWFIPYIKEYLKKFPNSIIIGLGDIYDDRKAIDINVNELTLDIFEDLGKIIPTYIINGNHDLSKKTNKGNSSLRNLEYVPGITIIKEPTLLKIKYNNKQISKIIAIPYLGDHSEENKWLLEFSGKSDYALMHTDISKMKLDNGMSIIGAVDATNFKGRIFSGHIHKRQESENVIYVGSPYQLRRSDIGNQKGIYDLNLLTNEINFTENNYSPIFHKIKIEDFINLSASDRNKFLDNNYNDIVIEEANIRKYKMIDIYDMANLSKAKRVQILINKSNKDKDLYGDISDMEYKELTIEELLNDSIEQLEVDDETKDRLKLLSSTYLNNALSEESLE